MIGWRILLWAVLVLAALLFLYLVRGILPPFIIAFVIASLLEPLIRKLRLRGMSRTWAVALVSAAFFVIVGGVSVVAAPRVAGQVVELQQAVVDVTQSLTQSDPNDNYFLRWNPVVQLKKQNAPSRLDAIIAPYRSTLERFGLPGTQRAIMKEYVEPNQAEIAQLVRRSFEAFFGFVKDLPTQIIHILLIPILTIMLLLDMEEFKRRSPRWIPPSLRAGTMRLFEDIGDVFMKYMRGFATVILFYTVAVTLLFLAMGVPYAVLIGLTFGVLYLIPYIGNIIAYPVLFLLIGISGTTGFQIENPWVYAILVTVMFIAVAFVFDHVLAPKMLGASVGLNPFVSMFVIFCGGALFGLPGMILAYPLAGSVKVILDRLLRVTTDSSEQLGLPSVPLRHRASAS